ncbi:reverse transcriptase domain-containing protein [Tanacetum coccineum]
MLLKKLLEKLRDPGKFLIPCEFPGMEICHALADLSTSINLMPLSIWKKLSLPDLTPTKMTLELADRSITRPKGVTEDVFVKVGSFHFPTDFVVVEFEADPHVPLILGRSFLRTDRTLIDVYEGELILRNTDEQIIFYVDGISKHSQKHTNESIKMIDNDDEKGKQEVKNIAEPRAKRQNRIIACLKNFRVVQKESMPQISSIYAITSTLPTIEPDDSFIMGDEHLSTFCVEEIVPIPKEFEDTFDNNKGCDLPFCDPLFSSKDDLTSSNDVSILTKDMEEDVENEKSNFFDEPVLPHSPFSDKVECFDPGDDMDEIEAFLAIEVPTDFEEDHEPQHVKNESDHDTLIASSPRNDPLYHEFAEEIDLFPGPDDLIPPSVENDDSEDEDNSTFFPVNESSILDPSFPRPPLEPPDVEICLKFETNTAVKNNFDVLNKDDYFKSGGGATVISQNVEDDDSFTFVI